MEKTGKKQLYLQLSRHNDVQAGPIQLSDIAKVYGSEETEVKTLGETRVKIIPEGAYGRYSLSAGEIAGLLLEQWPEYTFVFLGDPDIVLEYRKPQRAEGIRDWLWTAFVSVVIFVGSAFTIMTFIREANIDGLFSSIYVHLGMHGAVDTHGIEIAFAIGIGLGMLLYFNHFGKFRLQQEPTPMEMEMHQYMEDAEETVLEAGDTREEE